MGQLKQAVVPVKNGWNASACTTSVLETINNVILREAFDRARVALLIGGPSAMARIRAELTSDLAHILDEEAPAVDDGRHQRLARPASLEGLTVGLLDISKPRGDVFLDRIEERLTGIGANVKRFAKPTFAKPAPVDLRHEIATECQVVIEALAD